MTYRVWLGATALGLLSATGAAQAGGLDRSGQPITAIFETGSYAELSFGQVSPTVEGLLAGVLPSGDVAPSYFRLGGAVKTDINDRMSVALIFDQPFGASVEYTTAGYPLAGSSAHLDSTGLTALGRYKLGDRISVHAGLRYITMSGDITLTAPSAYGSTYSAGSALGYVVGAAYEIPDIALRAAVTYSSATDFSLDGTVGDASTTMPQSVNLDVQTGIAANTLLFGSVRWTDWSETAIVDTLAGTLISYDEDVFTYSLGVGRKFSDTFSGAVTLGYEASQGGLASNLSPTDGYFSVGLGGTYTKDNMKITGGISYILPGDATTELVGAEFSGNSAIGAGVKIAFSF